MANVFKELAEFASEGLIYQEADGRIKVWNKMAGEIFDLPAEQALGQTSKSRNWDLIHENGSPCPGEEHPSMITLATGRALSDEIRGIQRPDGSVTWLSISTRPIFEAKDEPPRAVVISFRDITSELDTRRALRRSEARFRSIFESTRVSIALVSAEGRFLSVNQAFCRMLGYEEQELTELEYGQVTHPEDIEQSRACVQNLLRGREDSFELEKRYLHKDGRTVWGLINLAMIRDEAGQPFYFVAKVLDITQRKLDEEALEESRLMMAQSQIVSDTGSHSFDIQTGKLTWSDQQFRIFGYRPGEVEPDMELISSHIHPDDQRAFLEANQAFFTGRRPYDITYRINAKDDQTRTVHSRALLVRDDKGRPIRTYGATRDITEQEKTQERNKKTIAALGQAEELAGLSYFERFWPTGEGYWSEGFFRLLGLKTRPTTHSHEDFLSYVHPEDRARVAEYIRNCVKTGVKLDFEFRIKQPDGKVIEVHGIADTKYDDQGRPLTTAGVFQDITEQRRIEGQLRQTQKMQALGTLAGGIAHDFNNILAAIVGFAEISLDEIPEGDSVRENVARILQSAFRARDLVNQILSFSRVSEPERQLIDPAETVEETFRMMRATVPATIGMELNLDRNLWPVEANRTQVHQLCLNLIANAVDAVKFSSGDIRVSLTNEVAGPDLAEKSPDLEEGDYVTLSVRDSGPGMDELTLERIFEPFFTTKEVGQGTGMGLSVVHGIAQGHGGAVTVDSAPGQGAEFKVYLPAAPRAAVKAQEPREALETGSGRILFVDDEDMLASLAAKTLDRLGYRAEVKTSAQEALAAFMAEPASFDLLITDMTMPEMTGADLAREVLAVRPDLPIILCTGYSERLDDQSIEELGIKKLLMKPLTVNELGRSIKRLLENRSR